ncbi:MAG: ATP phosphoribosyltransferase regulatory subunit [Candidatus Tokpelaia sp. JSC085]|nr:MAG: ATP phosphoribosyltransferase regulatory subunit [Candidatus Tokpelaia sp. JSC085]
MHGYKTTIDAVSDYFMLHNLTLVDIAILQPADPFLDMVGEDLRRRIFMTESENGDRLCLRPEFTIPVCLQHIESGRTTPQNYAYRGEIFRQRRNGTAGFYQAGIEEFGAVDEAKADARSFCHAAAILRHIAPDKNVRFLIGDHAIFAALLAALHLPHGWQKKMLRCFGNNKQLRLLLFDLAKPADKIKLPTTEINQLAVCGDKHALIRFIEKDMLDSDLSPVAGRTPKDIAERLIEKHALANCKLSKQSLAILDEFLAIEVSLDRAEQTLRDFASRHNLALDKVLSRFSDRVKAIDRQGLYLPELRYKAAFGRALDYYTDFVYEIHDDESESRILAGGGRYDRLLTMLGAQTPIPAIGFSIWLDRL